MAPPRSASACRRVGVARASAASAGSGGSSARSTPERLQTSRPWYWNPQLTCTRVGSCSSTACPRQVGIRRGWTVWLHHPCSIRAPELGTGRCFSVRALEMPSILGVVELCAVESRRRTDAVQKLAVAADEKAMMLW